MLEVKVRKQIIYGGSSRLNTMDYDKLHDFTASLSQLTDEEEEL